MKCLSNENLSTQLSNKNFLSRVISFLLKNLQKNLNYSLVPRKFRKTQRNRIESNFDLEPCKSCAIPPSRSIRLAEVDGAAELSHWSHGPRALVHDFPYGLLAKALNNGAWIRWDTRPSLSLSLSPSFSVVQRIVRGPCTLPDSFLFVGNNAPLTERPISGPFRAAFYYYPVIYRGRFHRERSPHCVTATSLSAKLFIMIAILRSRAYGRVTRTLHAKRK